MMLHNYTPNQPSMNFLHLTVSEILEVPFLEIATQDLKSTNVWGLF